MKPLKRQVYILTQGFQNTIDFEDLKNDSLYDFILERETNSQPKMDSIESGADKAIDSV